MNVLNTNNRFSSLLVANNNPSHNYHAHRDNNSSRSYYNKYNHDSKNVIKKGKVPINIDMNDFPALIETQMNSNIYNITNNYVKKVLFRQANTSFDKVDALPYGWILIEPHTYNTKKLSNIKKIPYTENAFVTLYNKRKEAYIELWGYEEYEKMFLFPTNGEEDKGDDDEYEDDDDSSIDEYYQYDDDDYYN